MSINTYSSPNREHSLKQKFRERVKFNEPLAPYLFYKVGGPADIFVEPKTEDELLWLDRFSLQNQIPITTIGSGTNLVVRDEGIRGITICTQDSFTEIQLIEEQQDSILVQAGGGVSKPALLNWAAELGYSGLEFSSGVPGTIGGGIYMNAGTKYGSYGDILTRIRLFDYGEGPRELRREEIEFGYRNQSVVKNSLVIWAEFELRKGNSVAIKKEVQRIIDERAAKQPLDYPSCGSAFKNPEGYSAGRLIEKTGLKGLRIGGAEISEKHANFILNKGNATANDILALIDRIKQEVLKQFDVSLECEVIVLGGEPPGPHARKKSTFHKNSASL